ncbi:amino acid adenylation domain-containing protein [Saccharothrix saharensis]|uniref:Amino acid adenylation domain-containing protein n=1 Tax=Saccharothrix saharensis TaxID=571190 RepID=A0A543JRQ6_9PSEU|nr:non-ribosomal peptide synthetase [Saccharothrix saharensis]TQM85434.1 amino acid adenylation domain-containing protein [Saccharothrix saharensis]
MADSVAQARRELLRRMLSSGAHPSGTPSSGGRAPAEPVRTTERPGRVPTSAAQNRLWFLDQLNGPNAAYNVPFALRLRGALDEDALWGALDDLVARHEVLRTTFEVVDDEVYQVIGDPWVLPRDVVDLRALSTAERDPAVDEAVRSAAARPFRLDGEPLMRASLLRVDDHEHHLVLNLHHIVTDGWSEGVLFREFGQLYSARTRNAPADLPPAAQYADYAVWEAGQAGGPLFEAQLEHWRERLSGHLGEASIPADRPRPDGSSTHGDNVPVPAPADLRARLGGTSLFTGVTTALAVLLHRYGDQDRVIIGVPVVNRTRADWESAVGFFANTVALRVDLSDNPTLAQVAERVTAEILDALTHQHVPFDRVVDALDAQRGAGMNPVFQVMCSVNATTPPPEMAGLDVRLRAMDNDTAKFDLELAVEYDDHGVECRFEYATDLFDRPTVEAMSARYLLVLEALLTAPGTRVGDLALADEAEATVVLDGAAAVLRDRYGAPVPVGVPGRVWTDGRADGRVARVRRDGVVEEVRSDVDGSARPEEFLEPETPVERELAAMWAEVLGRGRVGRDEDFFRGAGGDSMLATKVVVRVRRKWGVRITVRQMLRFPVLKDLAAHLATLVTEASPDDAPVIHAAPAAEDVPLSFAQQRLWFIDQLEPDSAAYNIAELLELTGPLRVDALERALNSVVARHEALRTSVAVVDGVPMQRIAPELELTVAVVAGRSPGEALAEAWREADRPFDLASGPLLRAAVYPTGPDRHLLAFTWHHLVFDGWSQDLFFRELTAFYARETGHDADVPPPPVIQYADYTRWQRASLRDAELARLQDFWSTALAGAPALLELPTDRPRPAVRGTTGDSRFHDLPADLVDGLRAVADRHGVTLYLVLFAAFNALLARHTGQTDIVVGGTTANRATEETEGVVGLFVNTLALRTDVSGNPAFGELAARARDTVTAAYAHQDLPFEQVVELLRVERSSSRTPLFQVLFDYQEGRWSSLELDGLTVRRVRGEDNAAMFDLTLIVVVDDDGLHCDLQYAADLFDGATAVRLLDRWETVLRAVVRDPDARVHDLDVLPDAERELVLRRFGAPRPAVGSRHPVPARIAAQAARRPGATALVHGDRRTSYADLDDLSARLAAHLVALGVRRGDRVVVCAPRGIEYVIGSLAAMRAGAAYAPVDAAFPAGRVAQVLATAGAAAVLVTGETRHLVEGFAGPVVAVDEPRDAAPAPAGPIGPDDAAYVIHTSGSTGQPKGVLLDHGGLALRVDWYNADCATTERDRMAQVAGTGFDVSVLEIWSALAAGAELHLADPDTTASGEHVVRWLTEHRITIGFLPTPLCELALDGPWPADSPLRVLTTGGDALRKRPPADAPFTLLNLYGPAEATVVTTSCDVPPTGSRVPPIGIPVPGTRVHVLDHHLRPVGVGVPGDLHVGGPGVALGYVGRPDLTADRFVPDPFGSGERLYRTGDLVRWLPDGTLDYLGRIDTQVQVRGFRVELGEVEAVLLSHPDVTDAVVVARDVPGVGLHLVAYVVGDADPEDLRAHLRERLPDYMVPATVHPLPALPLNRSGKVDRAALPEPDRAGGEEHVAPRTDVEKAVAAIWCELLRVDRVGLHANFFALGGHSLLATQVVTRLRTRLHCDLPVRQLFETPTVAELAAVLTTAQTSGPVEPAVVKRERRLQQLPATS